VSNLSQQKIFLEAAQQSFLKVSNLSLFNYL
jgi:flagellin-like hook-associated protein FlgL